MLLVGLQCVAFPDHTNGEQNILLIYYVTSKNHSLLYPNSLTRQFIVKFHYNLQVYCKPLNTRAINFKLLFYWHTLILKISQLNVLFKNAIIYSHRGFLHIP